VAHVSRRTGRAGLVHPGSQIGELLPWNVAHKPPAQNASRGANRALPRGTPQATPRTLPIAELIEDTKSPSECAIGSGASRRPDDGHHSLAMPTRRKSETLASLLTRLDRAISKTHTEDVFTEEINRRRGTPNADNSFLEEAFDSFAQPKANGAQKEQAHPPLCSISGRKAVRAVADGANALPGRSPTGEWSMLGCSVERCMVVTEGL
jgi:hypothetical protein